MQVSVHVPDLCTMEIVTDKQNDKGQSEGRNEGQLSESMRFVPSQEDLISLVDLHKHGLCILARVVVWMPCLSQLPVAVSYLLK